MKLYAISDLHLSNRVNREAFLEMGHYPNDWLILGGDIAEKPAMLEMAFAHCAKHFQRVIWVPGNHELWSIKDEGQEGEPLRGLERYNHLIDMARSYDVITPEDPYSLWPNSKIRIVPTFVLYDYSWGPIGMTREEVIKWASEERAVGGDEIWLSPKPHKTMAEWCEARLDYTETRLDAIDRTEEIILINHFPLKKDLVFIPRIPRFVPWCGTAATEEWHQRYNIKVAVSGHLHVRRTDWIDGVRFEEVSLGYQKQWDQTRGFDTYLREILPDPVPGNHGSAISL